METKISINLNNLTCSIEIHDLYLNRISNLSAIKGMIAEQLIKSLEMTFLNSSKEDIEKEVNLLLEGKNDIQRILQARF